MSTTLKTDEAAIEQLRSTLANADRGIALTISPALLEKFLADAQSAHRLHTLVNNPHTADFLEATRFEAAHQRDRWGTVSDRSKSAEYWFWLVGYLAGKCLRAVITGDKQKALHHTISSAAALANWYEAIKHDTAGAGIGTDRDIAPRELAALPVVDRMTA